MKNVHLKTMFLLEETMGEEEGTMGKNKDMFQEKF